VPGLRATVARNHLANLTPASGGQDHTILPSASAAPVSRSPHVHRIPHPTFVTIAKRPSGSEAGRDKKCMISDFRKEKFLSGQAWMTRSA